MVFIFHVVNVVYHTELIYTHRWTYLQNRNRPTDIENKLMVTKGERGGRGIN